MSYKNTAIWRKALLLVGLGLTATAIVEVKTSAFGAQDEIDRDRPSEVTVQTARPLPNTNAPIPPEEALISDAPPTDSLTTLTSQELPANAEAANRPQDDSLLQTASKRIASNNAVSDGAVASNIADFSAQELTVAAWAGASFPVENFQAYTSPFGYRQSPDGGYRREFHYGLDIAAPQGSYIRSWWSGTVLEVTDNTNCGTSIVIQSGAWVHIYCHMQGRAETSGGRRYLSDRGAGIQIWEGQAIRAGDRIGRVGMTGRTTGPHLHWGLKYNGNWVDPAWVIRAMAVSQQASTR